MSTWRPHRSTDSKIHTTVGLPRTLDNVVSRLPSVFNVLMATSRALSMACFLVSFRGAEDRAGTGTRGGSGVAVAVGSGAGAGWGAGGATTSAEGAAAGTTWGVSLLAACVYPTTPGRSHNHTSDTHRHTNHTQTT